ncbi:MULTISPECIES: hypothetical protein [unclassified Clostridioides]|uniref:hypothetical protein n=1 Tax=unclassified Clostridioides TaxID=2635829 RepID=UPI001D11FE45|nr:hypothetical protein [Clostridioides sp. ES-S-0049-03]MCC0678418.1 hypothetical protein [Clostridioides sp. ES-W-0018-02]MCC0682529.1 hypothetical protein [Clostridioides sp. ES-S-0005-03]MCC0707257.1 hypothetical protein [Clostridioides sp. ES-S-0190-01]MCC0713245.1 hypothetical protein [Clostridioides sp. ES-W-0017-02]
MNRCDKLSILNQLEYIEKDINARNEIIEKFKDLLVKYPKSRDIRRYIKQQTQFLNGIIYVYDNLDILKNMVNNEIR